MSEAVAMEWDTVFYTGRNVLAEGNYLAVATLREAVEGVLRSFTGRNTQMGFLCTTRNGQLCSANPDHLTADPSDQTSHVVIPEDYHDDVHRLMRALLREWLAESDAAVDNRDAANDRLTVRTRTPGGDRPGWAGSRRLMAIRGVNPDEVVGETDMAAGLPYVVYMDWSFPYLLRTRGDAHTRLFPFNLDTSVVNGSPLSDQGSWNRPRLVRFYIPSDFDHTRTYVTQEWRRSDEYPDGAWQAVGVPDAISWNGRARTPETASLFRADRSTARPRVKLPHDDGFLLLQRFFKWIVQAYLLLRRYRMAGAYIERDLTTLGTLEHLFELTGRSNPRDSRTTALVREAFQLTRHFKEQAHEKRTQVYDTFAQRLGPFRQLLNFWARTDQETINPSFRTAWVNDWHRFTNPLGPLAFMEIAVYLLRHSPLHEDFYRRYGDQMLVVPAGAQRTWQGAAQNNPMLVDQNVPLVADTVEALDWSKKALKVFVSINEMFMYHHARVLYGRHREVWWFTHTPPRDLNVLTRNYTRNFRRFVEYLTGMSRSDIDAYVGDLCVEDVSRWDWEDVSIGSERASPRQDPELPPDRFRQPLRRVRLLGTVANQLGRGSDVLDGAERIMKLMQLADSISRRDDWSTAHLTSFGYEVTQLSGAASSLLGSFAARAVTRTACARVAVGAAFVDVLFKQYHLTSSSLDTFRGRGNVSDVGIRALQAASAYLSLAAGITAFVPGAGWPATVVTGLLSIGTWTAAEVLQWHRDQSMPGYRRYAGQLVSMLLPEQDGQYQPPAPYQMAQYDPFARDIVHNDREQRFHLGEFRTLVQQYNRQKQQWAQRQISGSTLREFVVSVDNAWTNFPEARWRYLDMGQENQRGAYITYCQRNDYLDRQGGWPPGTQPQQQAPMAAVGPSARASTLQDPLPSPPPWRHPHPMEPETLPWQPMRITAR